MTDISVIKMIISVAVWQIYPPWVNDKLRSWEGLCHFGMFWPRLSRDDFRSKLEKISFLSRVMFISKSFFVSRAFVRFGAKRSSPGAFWFRRCLGAFLENSARSPGIFCELRLRSRVFFENYLSFFKAEPVLLAWQLWWSPDWTKHFGDGTSKIRMKTSLRGVGEIERRRTSDRRGDWYESLAVIHGPKEKKTKQRNQRVIVRSLNPSQNQRVLKNLFPRPDIATVLYFAVFMYVDVQLQVGQAAARGQRRKAVIRDISGVDHRGVTNLSASIWFTGGRYCTVFRHVMQLSLLVLC